MYGALTSSLTQNNQQQLNTGVQNISEDAAARGVLRSTIPVDARTTLTSSLGAALNQGLAQYGANMAKDISGVNTDIANSNLSRTKDIYSLANTLNSNDQQAKQNALNQQKMNIELYNLQHPTSSGGGSSTSAAQTKANLTTSLNQDIMGFFSSKDASNRWYTEKTVLPRLIAAYPELNRQQIIDAVYKTRKVTLGF